MKRPALIAGVALAFATVGIVVGAQVVRAPARPTPPREPAASSLIPESGPTRAQGLDHTEEGARLSAIAYATAPQDWLYLSDEQVDSAVRSLTTASAGPAIAGRTVADLRQARTALAESPGQVWWLVRPLASKVETFDPDSARVVVWTVTVLSAADVALPQADWGRMTIDLAWDGDAWRVQAVDEVAGPTPMTATADSSWQPEAFEEALSGFRRVTERGPS